MGAEELEKCLGKCPVSDFHFMCISLDDCLIRQYTHGVVHSVFAEVYPLIVWKELTASKRNKVV
jgi:hypothetical protein